MIRFLAKYCGALLVSLAISATLGSAAHAQSGADIEVPTLILDLTGGETMFTDEDIDLANIVLTAARGVTTVQEAPAIVTVITSNEIAERAETKLQDIVNVVPGWVGADGFFGQFSFVVASGVTQGVLYMNNELSLFDPFSNTPQVGRLVPVETIRRIELVSGPGGVLWGANSFVGILNVVTKGADDVDGVEAGISFGDGRGDQEAVRGYAMAGLPDLWSTKAGLFLHASFESYVGPKFSLPRHLFSTPIPQPNSQFIYGPLAESDPPRSFSVLLDAKLEIGGLTVIAVAPFVERHIPLGINGSVVEQDLAEDAMCSPVDAYLPDGQRNPEAFRTDDGCVDRARLARDNRGDFFDRYVLAKYKRGFADNDGHITFKAYGVQFVRRFGHVHVFNPSLLLEGGLGLRFDPTSYRAGTAVDGDYNVLDNVQLLYGAELFREWIPNNVETSRQGDGIEAKIIGPADLTRLALPCPQVPHPDQMNFPGQTQFVPDCPLTFLFSTNRTVLGAYVNPRLRAGRRLLVDGGARLQAAPDAFGEAGYDPTFIVSGAATYDLGAGFHSKVNYAQGFRPPVFNNTDSNGTSISIGGRRDLEVERSQALQLELNGRLFQDTRRVRELSFRAGYSLIKVEDRIKVVAGRYENAASSDTHTAELMVRLYLKGGHRFTVSYAYLNSRTEDLGVLRAYPAHLLNTGAVFTLIEDNLQVAGMLRIASAMYDPNRIVEFRGLEEGDSRAVQPYELVLDRLPPPADLQLALTYTGLERTRLRAAVYNAFDTQNYLADAFHDYEPRIEALPNPAPRFRFVLSATYLY